MTGLGVDELLAVGGEVVVGLGGVGSEAMMRKGMGR